MISSETAVPNYTLCLDFSNTVDWRNGERATDKLKSYADLVRWSKDKGLRNDELVAKEGGQGVEELRRAVCLREGIYRIFSAVAHEKQPNARDLEVLNGYLASSLRRSKVVRRGGGFQWASIEEGNPDKMLWRIAKSAADLLTSDQLDRVTECANEEEGCGWLFLDQSKSQNRKWCDMSSCGNRAKARKYYEAHEKVSA